MDEKHGAWQRSRETAMTAQSRFGKHLWILALLLVATLVLIVTPRPARAGEDTWTPFGPGGGALQSLTASPSGELYVTASFGATEVWQLPLPTVPWRWRNNGLGRPAVTALAVDPKSPSSLWAVSGNGPQSVFHSADGGGSWAQVFTGDADFHVVHLWVAPAKKSVVLFAETGNSVPRRLLRSANGGVSWTEVPGILGPVAAPPDEPGVVYAASEDGLRVVRSSNGGASFRSTGSLAVRPGDELRALHATFGRQATVFSSFRTGGLFRSPDGGNRWSRVGLAGSGPAALASEPKDPRTIYAVNDRGLYASHRSGQDGSDGATSHLVHTFAASDGVGDVATDPSAPMDLYAASMNGVLQSRDGGVTWEPTPGDFNTWGAYRQSIGHVQVHPTERGHLFAVPLDGGLFENQLTN
jgi:hypothetical protein